MVAVVFAAVAAAAVAAVCEVALKYSSKVRYSELDLPTNADIFYTYVKSAKATRFDDRKLSIL